MTDMPNQHTAFKLTPGSTVARVVELMRFLPSGTELRTSEFFARLEMKRCSDLAKQLAPAVEHGLLQREKRRVPDRPGNAVFWMAGARPSV
jgi:hypothetical protein